MMTGLYRIGSKLMLETQAQELHAQNLAGAGLCGFKGRHLVVNSFQQSLENASETHDSTYGVDVGLPTVNFTQGALKHTGRSLDFALSGEGFFRVETPDGAQLLTRNGNFRLSPEGVLVTQEGHIVQGAAGPIRFNPTDVVEKMLVSENGEIQVPSGPDGALRTVDTLAVGAIADRDRMLRLSANYFAPAEGQEVQDAESFRVSNGYQEQSNISPVREMAGMIQSLREFESGHKMIQTLNDMSRQQDQKMG